MVLFSTSGWHLIEHLFVELQWSPEQISLRLKEDDILDISHERINQHVIHDQQTGGDLHTHLRERTKRRKRYGSWRQRRGTGSYQVSIEDRPEGIESRDQPVEGAMVKSVV